MNNKIAIYVQIFTFLIIWGIILSISGSYTHLDLIGVVKKVPLAITIYAFLVALFKNWMWGWKIWRGWLIKIPNLQGTWTGQLKSDWIDPKTNKLLPPISAQLIIKQTLSSLYCELRTQESNSYSIAAQISQDAGGSLFLSYLYTNRSKIDFRDKSPIHDGATILKINGSPANLLEGEYWTSRKTRGEMKFKF